MSTFQDPQPLLKSFAGTARLFPLPNLVLFPQVLQPLHVFEPRYRELLAESLSGDRLIAMTLLAPGWERDYEGRPAVHGMACLAQVASYYKLKNGSYNVLLLGVQRARLIEELEPQKAFREARVELCTDVYPGPANAAARQPAGGAELRARLLDWLPKLPQAEEQIDQLSAADVPLGVLADVISYLLDVRLPEKQKLLAELDVYRRCNRLLRYLRRAGRQARAPFPPSFSSN